MFITWGCVLGLCLLLWLYRHTLYNHAVTLWQNLRALIGYGMPVLGVSYNPGQVWREASRLGIVMSGKPVIGKHGYWPRYWQEYTVKPLSKAPGSMG
jgi:hypothetical protein